eukprot:TRINITY_DN6205_c0_g1_i2.p1 TRINITY_DN6205_c0_g1~~TRINITY_DN6205_c0_g1_i2.p1  ORF type:complete len:232 (+),score=26.87 TRINITY_DN6205_c0_g1_i2:1056-1751(+)
MWFGIPPSDCAINFGFITMTIICCILISVLTSLDIMERGSLFTSSVLSCFCVTVTWSAVVSSNEGVVPACHSSIAVKFNYWVDGVTGFVAVLVVLYSTVHYFVAPRKTIQSYYFNTSVKSLEDDSVLDNDEGFQVNYAENKKPYNYAYFHLVMAFGSIYMGMVFTDWDATGNFINDVDSGILEYWIKFTVVVLTVLLYVWSIAAPFFIKKYIPQEEPSDNQFTNKDLSYSL